MKKVISTLTILLMVVSASAQEAKTLDFSTGVDLYSRYVWRGLQFSSAPNIQPYATLTWKNLSLMGWGSYATSQNYAEFDLFLSYNLKGVTLSLNDYYSEDETDLTSNDYSEWGDTLTSHLIEFSASYQLPIEKFPLKILASTFVYGADLNSENKQNYSSYIELAYPFTAGDYELELFSGYALNEGYYSTSSSFVNVGFKATRAIKITETFEIPFNTSLVLNPANDDVFFVVGFSF